MNALYDAWEQGFDACLINPAGYTTVSGPLRGAIQQVPMPVIEVHASNPTARGTVQRCCRSARVASTGSAFMATTWPWRQ